MSPGSPLAPCGVTGRDSQRPAGWRLGWRLGRGWDLPAAPPRRSPSTPSARASPSSPWTGPCPTPGPQVRPLPLTTGPLNPPGVPLIPKKPFPVPRAAPLPPPRLWPLSLCGAPRSAVRCPADPEVAVATDPSPDALPPLTPLPPTLPSQPPRSPSGPERAPSPHTFSPEVPVSPRGPFSPSAPRSPRSPWVRGQGSGAGAGGLSPSEGLSSRISWPCPPGSPTRTPGRPRLHREQPLTMSPLAPRGPGGPRTIAESPCVKGGRGTGEWVSQRRQEPRAHPPASPRPTLTLSPFSPAAPGSPCGVQECESPPGGGVPEP